MSQPTRLCFAAGRGEVSALLWRPATARWLLVLGHGAGAGMQHAAMEGFSRQLAACGVATFRYQFLYMEQGKRRPDSRPLLIETVRAAAAAAAEAAPDLPRLAGGKSMGGRMTSLATAEEPLAGVQGLVFLGFPLHPAGRPTVERAANLPRVTVPMLYLQGSRDRLADQPRIRDVC